MFTRSKMAAVVVFSASLIVFALSPASAAAKTKVRALSPSELRSAQRRLIEMGYPSGPMGVMTFQKWEGRKVSSRLTRADYEAIMNASAPQAKDADYGHVEVDLDRQVLLLIGDDGSVKRILPVSTGSGRRYNEKGMKGLAYTPRGRFRIYNKLSGWRKSPLGLLYYPNYFSDGLAIHGNPSVPHSPQSHGCIRVPMSAARDISRSVQIGTIVLIYDKESFVSAKDWANAQN
ncbi:MAG TPA: L,D-transpeptidase [Pyrinomonadaceae bacterium]|nr:L,D-transpeptidase [Pyrinomonadaceae bacterium]